MFSYLIQIVDLFYGLTVFNVTDQDGKKLEDKITINGIVDYIREVDY